MTELPIAYLSAQFSDTQFKKSTVVKEDYAIYYCVKKWRPYLEDAEILLKSDTKSLEKFLEGRTDNLKLGRWSLELQGRRITCEHIPGTQNKAADCLSGLPFVHRKRGEYESTQVNHLSEEDITIDCRLCEIDMTDTVALQKQDKHCTRIKNLMDNSTSKFPGKDKYIYNNNTLCHMNLDNRKEYMAVVPKSIIPTVIKEMHDKFGHFGVGKTYSVIRRYYFWPKMIKHIQRHVESCSLCRREKLIADKYQLETTEIPAQLFTKVSVDLMVDLPISHKGNKNILVMVDHLTGYPIVEAIPNKEAPTVAEAIYNKLIMEHTCPKILLSNNGKEFTNDTLAYVCDTFATDQHFTSPYMPQSNGKTENFNKFLKASIR